MQSATTLKTYDIKYYRELKEDVKQKEIPPENATTRERLGGTVLHRQSPSQVNAFHISAH